MPDSTLMTYEAAVAKATDIKAALATSKVRFFKSTLVPDQNTTRVALLAAECDFDGYTAGGYELLAFTGPIKATGGGAVLTSPLVNVAYGPAGDPPVPNTVGGWWIDDDTAVTPQVRIVGIYNPARPMAAVGDGFAWIWQDVEGVNPAVILND